ncbi:proteasome assembly chaperone 3 [Trichophaea hybrida]|nr:proteasome assembly chaperone 3 [Trichophaea hybrida]
MDSIVATGYPATTKRAAGFVKDVPTVAMIVGFADKILITITQDGRLAQWFHVPLDSANRVIAAAPETNDDSLLPLTHLTPTTLLGGTVPEREAASQLLAVQIASIITTRNKDEGRMIVCGLGLKSAELDQSSYLELVELVGNCL